MISQLFRSLALIVVLLGPWMIPQPKDYNADRFDVDIAVQDDGSLEVTERLTLRFEGGPFTYVYRHLEPELSDGIDVLEARIDGAKLPEGTEAGYVEIEGRDPVKVTWHFAPTSDGAHTFELVYRVWGVVQQAEDADVLTWQALPEEHEYAIASSAVQITYPEKAALVSAPEVPTGEAEVSRESTSVTFVARDLEPDDYFVVRLRFEPGSLIDAPPDWQVQRQAIRQRGPIFVVAAVVLLVGGVVWIALYHGRYHRGRDRDGAPVTRPPSELEPALAGVLVRDGSMAEPGPYVLATCFELARRGLIVIEEVEGESWWQQRDYAFTFAASDVALSPLEQAFVEAVFHTQDGQGATVRLSKIEARFGQWIKPYHEALRETCEARNFFDPVRRRGRNTLLFWGIALIVLALGGLVPMGLFIDWSGAWPLLICGSLFALGVIALIASDGVSPLTDRYFDQAQLWKRFARYLRDVARHPSKAKDQYGVALPTHLYEAYLPYATAFGHIERWGAFLKQHHDVEIPSWFRALQQTQSAQTAAFVAMIAATSSSTGSTSAGTAGAAAGAAGGGASGAG